MPEGPEAPRQEAGKEVNEACRSRLSRLAHLVGGSFWDLNSERSRGLLLWESHGVGLDADAGARL